MPPTSPDLTAHQLERARALVAQLSRLLASASMQRPLEAQRVQTVLHALGGEAKALGLSMMKPAIDRFKALLGTSGGSAEELVHMVPLLQQATAEFGQILELSLPSNPFSRAAENRVQFDQVLVEPVSQRRQISSQSLRALTSQDASRRASAPDKGIERDRRLADALDLPPPSTSAGFVDDILSDFDDDLLPDFDAFLEEDLADNSIFSPASPHKQQLLPEARSVHFEGSGLLMVFDQDADLAQPLPMSPDPDDPIDIDIQPVERLTDVERAMRSLVDRLGRILTRLMDSLELLLTNAEAQEALDIARQLNRIARTAGLFQLDNHLPMISYIMGLLPVETPTQGAPYVNTPPRALASNAQRVLRDNAEELLSASLALVGWLIEDIPGLNRERYESGFINIYDTLGWAPRPPSDAAPTRQGWAAGQLMEAISRQVYVGIQETLDGISRSLLDGQPEGFQLATAQLRQIAEVLANQQISDVVVHLSRLAEMLRGIRPISPPVEQIATRFEALLSALNRWFPSLPLDSFRQHIRSLCNTFRFTQRQRTNPTIAALPAQHAPARESQSKTPLSTHAIHIHRAPTHNTNELAAGLLQLIAKLDALSKDAVRVAQQPDLKALTARLPQLPALSEETRQRGLAALALAVDVLLALLAQPLTSAPGPHPIAAVGERMEALLALSMEALERGLHTSPERTPLSNPETFFTISRRWPLTCAAPFQALLQAELDAVLLTWRGPQRATKPPPTTLLIMPEQHRQGIERLERVSQVLASETLSEALISHQHSLPSILQDPQPAERLSRAIQRVERFCHEAIAPVDVAHCAPTPAHLQLASRCRRWLQRAFEATAALDTPGAELPQSAVELLSTLARALLERALSSGPVDLIAALCLLQASATQARDPSRDPTLRAAHIQRALATLSRQVHLLAPELPADPPPFTLQTMPSADPWARVRPAQPPEAAPAPAAAAPLPLAPPSLPPRLGAPPLRLPLPLPGRPGAGLPLPAPPGLRAAAPAAPAAPAPAAPAAAGVPAAADAVAPLLARLTQRAAALGRALSASANSPWPAQAPTGVSAWALLAALEELSAALIDRAWPISAREISLDASFSLDSVWLSVLITHDGAPLPAVTLRAALDRARCLDAYTLGEEALIHSLCSHPEAALSLDLGPALTLCAALLRGCGGDLLAAPAAPDAPPGQRWLLRVPLAGAPPSP
jgi:hypothetical protein